MIETIARQISPDIHVDDCVQEMRISLLKQPSQRVARFAAIDYLRSGKVSNSWGNRLEHLSWEKMLEDGYETSYTQEPLTDLMAYEIIAMCKHSDRVALYHWFWLDMPADEEAEICNRTASAIRYRRRNLIKRIREMQRRPK